MTPELQAAANAAIAKAVKAYQIAVNGLTEQQTCEAFKQAIACGDFQRYVNLGETRAGTQAVTYIPFRREQELKAKIDEMRHALAMAQPYVEGEGTEAEITQLQRAMSPYSEPL